MRKSIAVIGEGVTEKYYIESLKGISPFVIMPRELGMKASSLTSLRKNIKKSIEEGYDEVYCLIDMDGKNSGTNKVDYLKLKNEFHDKTFVKRKNGTETTVFFIETERCIELWFLYYFTKGAVTKKFNSYNDLEKELKKYRPNYDKSKKYFNSLRGIHRDFENSNPKGSIRNAIANSKSSCRSSIRDSRSYTYSEMYKLIDALGIS